MKMWNYYDFLAHEHMYCEQKNFINFLRFHLLHIIRRWAE